MSSTETICEPRQFTVERDGGVTLVGEVWDPVDPAGDSLDPVEEILMLHGGAQTRHAWSRAARRLSGEGYRVTAMDARGHGDSDWDPEGDYDIHRLAADLEAIVAERFPSRRPVIVGASLGGMTAMLSLGTGKDVARALVLVDVTPKLEAKGVERVGEFMRSGFNGFASLEEAADRLDAITRSPRLYRQWFVTMNIGLMGAGLSTLFGGTVMDGVLSFFSTCIVDATVQAMARKRITNFFAQAAGGAIATAFALIVMVYMAASNHPLPLSPSLIVAAGIVSLLAGGSFVAASQDALDGYVVTSSGRFLEGFVQTGGVILGVITAMWIGLRLGVPGYISPALGFSTNPVLQMVAAAVIAVTFGISSHAGYRTLAICAALGAAAWAGYLLGMQLTGSVSAASGLAAMVAGFIAGLGAKRWKVPQLGLVTIAIVPLMPGVMMYRALYMIVNAQNETGGTSNAGWTLFLEALLVGVALAVGGSFGALLARPFTLPKDLRSRLATLASWGAGQAVPRERRRRRSQPPADPHHPALNNTETDPTVTGTWAR